MKLRQLSYILCLFLFSCSTIHFDNGLQTDREKKSNVPVVRMIQSQLKKTSYKASDEFHHYAAFRLLEVSAPIITEEECNDTDWATVKVEESFLSGILGGIAANITFGLWSFNNVEVYCDLK